MFSVSKVSLLVTSCWPVEIGYKTLGHVIGVGLYGIYTTEGQRPKGNSNLVQTEPSSVTELTQKQTKLM